MKTLLITEKDIISVVHHFGLDFLLDRIIEGIRGMLLHYDERKDETKQRMGFLYDTPHPGVLEWMPYKHEANVTIKIVSYNPENPKENQLPTILSTFLRYDSTSGHFEGLCDGTFLTALRTGAASAITSRILAHPDSSILGLIGCGAQAVTQLHAISRLFDLEKVYIYDIDQNAVATFKARTPFFKGEIIPANTVKILKESDILCTATSVSANSQAVLKDGEHKPWLHINAVGSDLPGKIELPLELLKRAFICPDFLDQALIEGECQQLKGNLRDTLIGPDIIDLVKNESDYTVHQNHLSVFDSTGFALEDHATMDVLLELCKKQGLGTNRKIEPENTDNKDPYAFLKPYTQEFIQPADEELVLNSGPIPHKY